jgi:hypothetical protein
MELLHVLREWSAQSGYKIWREQDAAALIDRFAAQQRGAALEEGAAPVKADLYQ